MNYIARDILIIAASIAIIFTVFYFIFGTFSPFYVVSSDSMVPALNAFDVIIIETHTEFDQVKLGDIIVFHRPQDEMVIVHRVILIKELGGMLTMVTKGDANMASSNGTDFPITEDRYMGRVQYVIPFVGYVTILLMPPINYILIVALIVFVIINRRTTCFPS